MREPMRLTNLLFLTVYLFDCENYLGNESIGVRAGGARGAAAPPKFWATQIFWAARVYLGKASF